MTIQLSGWYKGTVAGLWNISLGQPPGKDTPYDSAIVVVLFKYPQIGTPVEYAAYGTD